MKVFLSCLLGLLCWGVVCAETVHLDSVRLEVEPLAAAGSLQTLEQWFVPGEASATLRGGRLLLHTPDQAGATVWSRRTFGGSQLLRFRARFLPSAEGVGLSFSFCASPSDGSDRLASLTLDDRHEAVRISRYVLAFGRASGVSLRKYPGGHLVDENRAVRAAAGVEHDIAVLKADKRLKVFLNGRPCLDWWDYSDTGDDVSLAGGYAGFRTGGGRLEISGFRADRVSGWSMAALTAPKELCLQTDLARAQIVAGPSAVHQKAALALRAAIEQRLGQRLELVSDADSLREPPPDRPLLVVGNRADNRLLRRLYEQWYCLADRRFPGAGGTLLQTIHNPWGTGHNVVVVGASGDAELPRAVEEFVGLIPPGGKLGRLYQVQPGPDYAKLREWTQEAPIKRLLIPVGWPHNFALADYGGRDDARQTGVVYLLTGDESRARLYREQMLRQVDKGVLSHLYVPGWMEVWDLLEEHPVFSPEDRLKIANWFLEQLRSGECMGALHVQRLAWGMPHQNHGTRPALGSFFMARYFQNGYRLPEADVYLGRLARYFDMQADWSKPMCDSSMHQYEATLTDKALYALASGQDRFFTSGAARQAAERVLRTSNNVGLLPMIGDGAYGNSACSLLAMVASRTGEGRYLWPISVRENAVEASSDEVARGFADDVKMTVPRDLEGVSVIPYDRGFWSGWRNLPAHTVFNAPNITYERAFDKIAFRTGLGRDDEFLLLDGMVAASHDYDDTNTVHEYMRHGRSYLVSMDGLFSSTFAMHNGVNIIRDGLSTPVPYFAEHLRSAKLDDVMVSQTRLNDFSDADWTRTIALVPGRYFVVLDRVQARRGGTFSLTGHWKLLGEPQLAADTLTVSQWPKTERSSATNTTFFHLQTPIGRLASERLSYLQQGLAARYYPFAQARPTLLSQARTVALLPGGSAYLYTLAQETANEASVRFRSQEAAPGVVCISDGKQAAYTGAPAGPVSLGTARLEADFFHLDAKRLTVVGGRSCSLGGKPVLASRKPVTATFDLRNGAVTAGDSGSATFTRPTAAALEALARQLLSGQSGQAAGAVAPASEAPTLRQLWEYSTGSEVRYLRTCLGNPGAETRPAARLPLPVGFGVVAVPTKAGQVVFLDARGQVVRRLDAGAPVNDVAVDDLDHDGKPEILIARHDARLSCLEADGSERFVFAPERQSAPNSQLQLGTNAALHVFVADRDGKSPKTVCVTTGDQRLHGVSANGQQLWRFHSYAGFWTRHGLYDLDGDGVKEIVGGNGEISDADSVYFLDGHDTFVKRILNDGWGSALSSLAIGDLNGDGREEIAIGTRRASLHVIDPAREGYLWSRNLGHTVTGCELVTGADGNPLLVAGSLSEFVVAFDGAGNKRWVTPVGGPVSFLQVAGVPGQERLIAALQDGTVVALSAQGELTRRLRLPSPPVALSVAGMAQDLILVASEDGTVRALTLGGG